MNIQEEKEEIEVTLCIKQYESGYDKRIEQTLTLQKSQQSYLLNKESFRDFIKDNGIINDDIDFNKVNIEFYDFQNGEYINQEDDILGDDNEQYIFSPKFLRNEQEMSIQIYINECPQSYYEILETKVNQFKILNEGKNDLLRQLDYLLTKQEDIQQKNKDILQKIQSKEMKSNIDEENKQQTF